MNEQGGTIRQTARALTAGAPAPLGVTWDGSGCNIAVFSENATKIELCLFTDGGAREALRLALPEKTGPVWHGYLAGLAPGTLYGLRAHGPYAPERGHRFNTHKLLLDPYARALTRRVTAADATLGYDPGSPESDLSFSTVDSAAALLEQWDNTASAATRGSVLFELWWNRYRRLMDGDDLFAVEWSEAEPMTTPRGLANIDRAIEAFEWAVPAAVERFGSWDVAWGDVHRVRRGDVDVPVGGCGGALGCFRVLNFRTDDDGRRVVNGGDGWVLAVEFGEVPRAYSILAYGQSPDPGSPWHDDQAALFAANRMKPVLWTEEDIARGTVLRYRPGQETH